jgi:hypothetical protein
VRRTETLIGQLRRIGAVAGACVVIAAALVTFVVLTRLLP